MPRAEIQIEANIFINRRKFADIEALRAQLKEKKEDWFSVAVKAFGPQAVAAFLAWEAGGKKYTSNKNVQPPLELP